jgi:hypothetical protein
VIGARLGAQFPRESDVVVETDDFAHHRAGIQALLRLAANLSPTEQDRIRIAVRARFDPARTISPRDASTGARLVAAMLTADGELSESQVAELEALIDSRLPNI